MGPIAVLNTTQQSDRVVFYDSVEVIDDLRAGRWLEEDDPREIWRFSLPTALIGPSMERLRVDLGSPDVQVTVHLRDPGCPPHEQCPMVTLNSFSGQEFSVAGEADVVITQEGEPRLFFRVDGSFVMENGVTSTVTYRGGGYQP